VGGKNRQYRGARGLTRATTGRVACAALWLGACAAGCGSDFGRSSRYARCGGDDASRQIADAVVALDWDGGVSHIYPDTHFAGIDLTIFETTDGGTLADHADTFKQLVQEKVTSIYCDLIDHSILLLTPEETGVYEAKTIVYFGQLRAPGGGGQVGEADYDPCNRFVDDEALIYGSQFARLGGPYSVAQWATMFANTTAHEIGHTLGYGHVTRADQPDPGRSLFVELMLDRHTVDELLREQRIVVEQTSCPAEFNVSARTIASGGEVDEFVFVCTHAHH